MVGLEIIKIVSVDVE